MAASSDSPASRWKSFRPYLKDAVYGANDGIVTTFAVISSVVGARLEAAVILIVGFASLFADGLSMAASDYLSSRTQEAQEDGAAPQGKALGGAVTTFVAFLGAGVLPLVPYVVLPGHPNVFWWAAAATAFALVLVGSVRTVFTTRAAWQGALEMLLVGGVAVVVAFFVGRLVSTLTGSL